MECNYKQCFTSDIDLEVVKGARLLLLLLLVGPSQLEAVHHHVLGLDRVLELIVHHHIVGALGLNSISVGQRRAVSVHDGGRIWILGVSVHGRREGVRSLAWILRWVAHIVLAEGHLLIAGVLLHLLGGHVVVHIGHGVLGHVGVGVLGHVGVYALGHVGVCIMEPAVSMVELRRILGHSWLHVRGPHVHVWVCGAVHWGVVRAQVHLVHLPTDALDWTAGDI